MPVMFLWMLSERKRPGDWQRSDENIEAGFSIETTTDLAGGGEIDCPTP